MIHRSISVEDVNEVLQNGSVITDYPNDKPYPSVLLLLVVNKRPIHVVVAKNSDTKDCIVVTCYEPESSLWNDTFTQKIR